MAGTFTIQSNPPFLNARSGVYTAWQLRNIGESDPPGPGVADYESFRVKQRGAGANLSADVGNTAYNVAWIRGTTRDGMGLYRAENADYTAPTANTMLAQINTGLIFTTGDASNPRIDQVFLRILDQQHDGGGSNLLQVQVVDGTATGSATLDNRTGVGAVPANSTLLADVLMPAAATTVAAANIRDRRSFPLFGATGGLSGPNPVLVNCARPLFAPGVKEVNSASPASMTTLFQSAAAIYIPNRIVGATRIRFTYLQGSPAMVGNYVIGIYDASGRKIVDTGSVAYTGALGTFQVRSETIAATTFEPGLYYVLYGHSFSSGSATFRGGEYALNSTPVPYPGIHLGLGSGGLTAPQTLSAFVDLSNGTGSNIVGPPLVSLTVG